MVMSTFSFSCNIFYLFNNKLQDIDVTSLNDAFNSEKYQVQLFGKKVYKIIAFSPFWNASYLGKIDWSYDV